MAYKIEIDKNKMFRGVHYPYCVECLRDLLHAVKVSIGGRDYCARCADEIYSRDKRG